MANDIFDSFRGKPEKQDYYSSATPWAPQQGYIQDLFQRGQNLYGQGLYAKAADDPNSLSAKSKAMLGDTISGAYLDPNTNPYLTGAVNDALGLAKSQFAGLYGGAAGQNVGNSGFQEQLARTLANAALPYYSNAYTQERQNQLSATNLANQFDYSGANAAWQDFGNYLKAIQGNYGTQGSQQAPWSNQLWNNTNNLAWGPAGFGNGPQIYGSTMQGAGNFFSDVRLKENIERVGTHDQTGVGIYKYTYVGDDTPQLGVLAQEIEQVKPEAVGEVAGFKTVNYKMI